MVDIELILLTQKNNDENGKNQADLDFNKNYPNTVIENRNILKRYLEILKIYNVKSILVVCYTSKYYHKCFQSEWKKQFFEFIDEIKYDF